MLDAMSVQVFIGGGERARARLPNADGIGAYRPVVIPRFQSDADFQRGPSIRAQPAMLGAFDVAPRIQDLGDPEAIHRSYIEQLKTDPLPLYQLLSARILKDGLLAETPEFAPVVYKIKQRLVSDDIKDGCATNEALKVLQNQALIALYHVSSSVAWYPYSATLYAILQAMQFFDVVERTKTGISPGYYHSYRYLHYYHKLINSAPQAIIFPTYVYLGATDILKMLGSPVYIAGINFKTEYVDEFHQTPLEFYIHDINHIRRFWEASEKHFVTWKTKKDIYSPDASFDLPVRLRYYTEQRTVLNELIQLISKESTIDKNVKQAIKIILFEILHEEAEPPLRDIVCNLITRPPADNYASGFKDFVQVEGSKVPQLGTVNTPSASLLAFVKFKLWYGFYDKVSDPLLSIASLDARKMENIAAGADVLLRRVCKSPMDTDDIRNLVKSNTGLNKPNYDSVFHHKDDSYKKVVDENQKEFPFTGIRPAPQTKSETENIVVEWTGLEKPDLSNAKPINPAYRDVVVGLSFRYMKP
jgi:hypothetical protein